jgi:uncharacterized OB-fold protein
MTDYSKPLPVIDADNEEMWASAKRHALALQRCSDCGFVRYPPGPICTECASLEFSWEPIGGGGSVYTWTEINRAPSDAFAADVPYVYAVVELDEGPMMPTNLVEVGAADVEIGMRVELSYDDVTDEVTLPKFRPAPAQS